MERLWQFIREKIPFALTGLVATGINYGMYLLLVDRYLPPGPATLIAYSSSVILNFFLQRYFVFQLNRSLRSAFILSMMASAFGLVLDWLIVTGLHQFPLLGDEEWIIKLVATFIVFFYNFYAKRRVFEGKRTKRARPQVQGPYSGQGPDSHRRRQTRSERGKTNEPGEIESEHLQRENSSPIDLQD